METIEHNNNLYQVKRRIRRHNFRAKGLDPNLELVKMWHEHLGYDHVLQDQNDFIFVNLIEAVEFEEVEKNGQS